MGVTSILVLAVGLALDAAAASAARGVAARRVGWRHALVVGALFGGFQALMPLLGWALGAAVGPLIARWDHWVAFALLAMIGGKMIWEVWRGGEERAAEGDPFDLRLLLLVAVATSVDALAAGITLPMLDAPMGLSVALIGLTAAALSVLGLAAGRHFGEALGRRLDLVGGVALIGLGVKVLVEHLGG
jgi:putative Mn2+ efflux pump MntP